MYRKFNKYIHDYFFRDENLGDNIVLAVDEYVIDQFCKEYDCRKEYLRTKIRSLFSDSWAGAINSKSDGIPQFFGLIAIQIYIASQMQKDDDYSGRMYNPRLADYLGVKSSILNSLLLREYQLELWEKLNVWAKTNHFEIVVPTKGKKYIKYPFSQALLNNEDFKRVPLIFKKVGINFHEELSLEDFKELVGNCDKDQTNHFSRVKDRLIKENKEFLLTEQLFHFYNNNWDGSFPDVEGLNSTSRKNSKDQISIEFFVDKKIRNICFFDQSIDLDIEFSLNNKSLYADINKYYNIANRQILLFEKDLVTEEWIYSRFLEIGKVYLIISPRNHWTQPYIDFLPENSVDKSNSFYSIKIVHVNQKLLESLFWQKFFSKSPKSFYIENGLKLDRKSYMHGAGPIIRFDKPLKAWINGTKISLSEGNLHYSLRDAAAGTYILKVNSNPKKIIIKKPKQLIPENNCGWTVDKESAIWNFSNEEFKITGLMSYFSQLTGKGSIQNWRKALLNSRNPKTQNSSVLINAIKRANYGI